MSEFRLDEKTKKNIEFLAKQTAKSLARDAREKLTDKYIELIDWYYVDYSPKLNKYDEPYYTRSFRLYKSYSKYYKNSSIIYGGVKISGEKMGNYPGHSDSISGQGLLDKFIYNPGGTWHGGDWNGGYGEPAGLNIYQELDTYYNNLLQEYIDMCSTE